MPAQKSPGTMERRDHPKLSPFDRTIGHVSRPDGFPRRHYPKPRMGMVFVVALEPSGGLPEHDFGVRRDVSRRQPPVAGCPGSPIHAGSPNAGRGDRRQVRAGERAERSNTGGGAVATADAVRIAVFNASQIDGPLPPVPPGPERWSGTPRLGRTMRTPFRGGACRPCGHVSRRRSARCGVPWGTTTMSAMGKADAEVGPVLPTTLTRANLAGRSIATWR